jgi:hypothetical protein
VPTESPPRKRRFWPRFTLRVLLVSVTLVGVGLGYWTHRARQQRRIVERIEQGGGMVCYERDGPDAPEPRNFAVEWLSEKLGRDYFESVTMAVVHDGKLVRDMYALPNLDVLTVYDGSTCDDDLTGLTSLGCLRILQIGDAGNPGGVAPRSRISDPSLRVISRLPQLTVAHLHGTGFTREGIKSLAFAPNLQQLDIDGCADSVQASDFDEIKSLGRIHILVAWRGKPGGSGLEKIVEWKNVVKQ